jgi:hypothetical protein
MSIEQHILQLEESKVLYEKEFADIASQKKALAEPKKALIEQVKALKEQLKAAENQLKAVENKEQALDEASASKKEGIIWVINSINTAKKLLIKPANTTVTDVVAKKPTAATVVAEGHAAKNKQVANKKQVKEMSAFEKFTAATTSSLKSVRSENASRGTNEEGFKITQASIKAREKARAKVSKEAYDEIMDYCFSFITDADIKKARAAIDTNTHHMVSFEDYEIIKDEHSFWLSEFIIPEIKDGTVIHTEIGKALISELRGHNYVPNSFITLFLDRDYEETGLCFIQFNRHNSHKK